MKVIRDIFYLSVVLGILLFAPFHYLIIEVIQIPETSSDKEVVFDESDQPLDFTFGLWMPRLTQCGIEAYCVQEVLIVRLPYWMVLEVPLYDDTFHVVCQHILRYSHICECTEHAYEQVLLLGIGKELNIHLAAVMTDHCEACHCRFLTIRIDHMGESPIHLVLLGRKRLVAYPSVSLWII